MIITGIPRSGTSYLCSLLDRFDNCVVINEPPDVIAALRRTPLPFGVATFLADTRRRIVAGKPILNKLSKDEVTADTALDDSRSLYVPSPARTEFVLAVKNTAAFLSRLEALLRVLPAVKVVACIRSPLDTIGSWKRTFPHLEKADVTTRRVGHIDDPWIREADREALRRIASLTNVAERRALWWRYFAEILIRNRHEICLLRYDDLAREPEAALARIGEGYDLGRLTTPLRPSEPRSSRALLDASDRAAIAELCMDVATELGVGAAQTH